MSKRARSHRKKERISGGKPPGMSPGTLVVAPDAAPPVIYVIAYGPDRIFDEVVPSLDQLADLVGKWPVVWVNVDGLGDAATIARLGEIFHLHPLALEDVVNVEQRAKYEPYPEYCFLVARDVALGETLHCEQISLFLGQGFVITFQETVGDSLDPVRARLRTGKGRLRSSGADYLAYAILDAIVDQYFPVLEAYGDRLESLEEAVLEKPWMNTMAGIHATKRELFTIRRSLWPMREALGTLLRDENPLFTKETQLYLRDVHDHVVRAMELVETYRELGADLKDLYLSNVSNRLNEVMKVLTIISTLFIPLTFIAGVYGMNFDPDSSPWNMPELRWRLGYPLCLALMAAVAAGLIAYFRRKKWL